MSSFMNALALQHSGPPPVWLMRQAGRYLSEYQSIRKHHTLLEMFHSPDIIVEVTQQPVEILGVDAAILFSDILTVLDGLSVSYDFTPAPEVHFSGSFQKKEGAYAHVVTSIQRLKRELSVPLIGFAGGPFTVLSYIVGGGKDLRTTKKLLFQDPQLFLSLIDQVTDETIDYVQQQVLAGVDVIQIFDSWAGLLAPHEFEVCTLHPLQRIVEALDVPVILFCRGSALKATKLATLNPTALSIDWQGDLPHLRAQLPNIALQGNLDPMVLYGSHTSIQEAVDRVVGPMIGDPGYIFNLGHGILPDIPQKNVQFLVNYVQQMASACT